LSPQEPRANRLLLANVMKPARLPAQAREWWHFILANEPYPETPISTFR
jgi:D-alanyl-D-alanine dipeptidase